jgi:hypothetical protein
MGLNKAQAYAGAAVLSGILWFLACYYLDRQGGGMTSQGSAAAFVVFALCGSLTGVVVSYAFRGALRRMRMPWGLLLPLATVPVGICAFTILLWLARAGFGYRTAPLASWSHELLTILSTYFFYVVVAGLYPLVYALALVNQWILHLILVEHGAYRLASRRLELVGVAVVISWIIFLVWLFAPRQR